MNNQKNKETMTFGLKQWATTHELTNHIKPTPNHTETQPKPFLKWVGGKREMIKKYPNLIPKTFNNYHEPFLGAGAMMFHLNPKHAYLNDYNTELITTYKAIATNVNEVINILEELTKHHSKQFYNHIRELDRNNTIFSQFDETEIAARLIYLNKTGFNGLYRVNQKGQYNVPIGTPLNKTIYDKTSLQNVSKHIKNYVFTSNDFTETANNIKKGDFVFLDPPYDPLTPSSNFTSYTKNQFTPEDQKRVHQLYETAHKKGAYVLLTNSNTPTMKELYKNFSIHNIHSSRSINSNPTKRGNVTEIAVTNYNTELQ